MKMDSKSETPKYWYQSTGRGRRNDRTMRPASGLKRKPCDSVGESGEYLTPLRWIIANYENIHAEDRWKLHSAGFPP